LTPRRSLLLIAGAAWLCAPWSAFAHQANVYELVVNRRTARSFGIELPRTLMLQATRVTE
jgi:hypothetical protein